MMKIFIMLLFISIFGCSEESIRYTQYKKNVAYNVSNESLFFNQWIFIPPSKTERKKSSTKMRFKKRYSDCIEYHKKAAFVGIVSLMRFKILPYSKNDSEKLVEIEAEIKKHILGLSKKRKIRYYMSLELDDSIGEFLNSKKIIFLDREDDNKLYLDRFCILPVQ